MIISDIIDHVSYYSTQLYFTILIQHIIMQMIISDTTDHVS